MYFAKHRNTRNRLTNGQALAEGVVALMLIIAVTVASVGLLLAIGTTIYYKIKLAFIADAGARLAASQRFWAGIQRQGFDQTTTQNNVSQLINGTLMPKLLPGSTAQVTPDLSSDDVATVKVVVDKVPLLSLGFLPSFQRLEEVASEPYCPDLAPARIAMTVISGGTARQFEFPAWGWASGTGPPGPQITNIFPSNTYGLHQKLMYVGISGSGSPAAFDLNTGP